MQCQVIKSNTPSPWFSSSLGACVGSLEPRHELEPSCLRDIVEESQGCSALVVSAPSSLRRPDSGTRYMSYCSFPQSCPILFGLQHTRLPCLSPSPGACWNSCPLSRWCHPTISSSVFPFSSCLLSFPESGSFPVSQLFTSHDQSIGALASASVL